RLRTLVSFVAFCKMDWSSPTENTRRNRQRKRVKNASQGGARGELGATQVSGQRREPRKVMFQPARIQPVPLDFAHRTNHFVWQAWPIRAVHPPLQLGPGIGWAR